MARWWIGSPYALWPRKWQAKRQRLLGWYSMVVIIEERHPSITTTSRISHASIRPLVLNQLEWFSAGRTDHALNRCPRPIHGSDLHACGFPQHQSTEDHFVPTIMPFRRLTARQSSVPANAAGHDSLVNITAGEQGFHRHNHCRRSNWTGFLSD